MISSEESEINEEDVCLEIEPELIAEKTRGNGRGSINELRQKVKNKIAVYDNKDSKSRAGDVNELEKLVTGEKVTLIKAFVNSAGEINEEYTLTQKTYLGLLKKISKKAHKNKRSKIDDKIIDKFALRRLEELAKISDEANKYAEMTSNKRDYYLKKHALLTKEYNEELRASDNFRELKDECKKVIDDLNLKLKMDGTDPELIEDYIEAKKDWNELNQRFRLANYRASSIKERMKVNYPQYVQTELYAETLIEQALSLNVAHEFYMNLYDDLKTARALKLKEFIEWNEKMDSFIGDYNKEVDNSARQIVNLFTSYKKSGNLLEGEHVLENYRQSIQETHEKLLKTLKEAKESMMDLEL